MPEIVPWEPDADKQTEAPFDLMPWIQKNAEELKNKGSVPLFKPQNYQSDIYIHGFGDQGKAFKFRSASSETFFWVLKGEATLKVNGDLKNLGFDDTLLVPKNSWIEFEKMSTDCAILSTTMDARNKNRL